MWTDTTRVLYVRKSMAFPSDLTEDEWAVLEPLLPPAAPFGRPRKWPLRRLLDAMFYLLRGGLPWRMLPQDFAPMMTVQRYFYAWRDFGLWPRINGIRLAGLRLAGSARPAPQCRRSRQPKHQNPRDAKPRTLVVSAAATRATRSRSGSAIS